MKIYFSEPIEPDEDENMITMNNSYYMHQIILNLLYSMIDAMGMLLTLRTYILQPTTPNVAPPKAALNPPICAFAFEETDLMIFILLNFDVFFQELFYNFGRIHLS